MLHRPVDERYASMTYNRCGRSGLLLPAISLGLWHNFGDVDTFTNSRDMVLTAFDLGITHLDLANNYGPPPGSAERNFGRILREDLAAYRDELVISSKAGYRMWPGPYGDGGSRKYLVASLDQSLQRMGLDYVDIFYSHRPDPDTPIDETMGALEQILRQGKAIYVGISSYDHQQTRQAQQTLQTLNATCLIHQPKYSMFDRWVEADLLDTLEELGIGCIPFCPLAQGLLTDKYLKGIPANSRAAKSTGFLTADRITPDVLGRISQLNDLARQRNQSLAQMALVWLLKDKRVTSALIGASSAEQIRQNVAALDNPTFTDDELARIETILVQPG